QREKADPTGRVNSVLMGMITVLGDVVGDVVDRDDPIEERDENKDQEPQGEVIQKRIEIQVSRDKKQQTNDEDRARDDGGDDPFAQPKPPLAQLGNAVAESPGG